MSAEEIPGRYAMRWLVNDALARTPHNGVWVEVGVALGRGIAFMARTLIDAGRGDVALYAVDPWAGTARNGEQQANAGNPRHGDWSLFLDTMQKHASEELRRINIIRAPSVAAAKCFGDVGGVDLCILDGDHTKAAVLADLAAWAPLIRAGGTLGGDDHNDFESPGVPQALTEFFGEGQYEIRDEEESWATWRRIAG